MTISHEWPVAFIGAPLAAELPRLERPATVIAVFRRSCYLETAGRRLFCVADRNMGEGPLTLGVELPSRHTLGGLGVAVGTLLERDGEDLRLGRRILLRTGQAAMWQPRPVSNVAPMAEIRRRLGCLIEKLQSYVPPDGMAPLVTHAGTLARGNLPATACAGAVAQLATLRVAQMVNAVISGDSPKVYDAVGKLVGLGPGLTPSGDDFLGGLMVALVITLRGEKGLGGDYPRWRGESAAGGALGNLSRSITTHSTAKTNKISAAMLEQAVEGNGNAAQHRLLGCLLETRTTTNLVGAALDLTRLGHTTGWDSLAGILLGVHLALCLKETGMAAAPTAAQRDLVSRPTVGALA